MLRPADLADRGVFALLGEPGIGNTALLKCVSRLQLCLHRPWLGGIASVFIHASYAELPFE